MFPGHDVVEDHRVINAVQIGVNVPPVFQPDGIGEGAVIHIVSIQLFLAQGAVKGTDIFLEGKGEHFQLHIPP